MRKIFILLCAGFIQLDCASELELFSINEVSQPCFAEQLKTSVSIITISNDKDDADRYGYKGQCGSYNGTALAFKAYKDDNPRKVLWYLTVRFLPFNQKDGWGFSPVVESKVEAKLFHSPDTYEEIYGVRSVCKDIPMDDNNMDDNNPESKKVFFTLRDSLSQHSASLFHTRKIFEWSLEKKFAPTLTSIVMLKTYNHVTPQDIMNGIATLRTRGNNFPWYTLEGINYTYDAINCCGFCIRALNAFGIPIPDELQVYLSNDYAQGYWQLFGRIGFTFKGPEFFKPDFFIKKVKAYFLGKPAEERHNFTEGDQDEVKTFFPLAFN